MSTLLVKISEQMLYVTNEQNIQVSQYPVSTSKYGIGNQQDSYKTPVGMHRIREKIGADKDINEVFIGRVAMGNLKDLKAQQTELPDDIITSRILWLEGLEPGLNQGDNIDSYQRYIYIHGTNEEHLIGTPASHGCIRMRNKDIIELFDIVDIGSEVEIEA